jgi:hypothetical protein
MARIATTVTLVSLFVAMSGCNKGKTDNSTPGKGSTGGPALEKKGPGEFISAEGHYKVWMPGTPQKSPDSMPEAVTMVLEENDGAYFVGRIDLPISANETDEILQERLDEKREGFLRSGDLRLKSEAKINLAGKYPGRAFEAGSPDGKTLYRMRTWIVNRRQYTLMVMGPESWVNSESANKFFDSFALTEVP